MFTHLPELKRFIKICPRTLLRALVLRKDSEEGKLFATPSLAHYHNLLQFGKSAVIPKSSISCFPGILTQRRLLQCYDSCVYISSKTRQWRNRTLRCCCFPSTSHGRSYYRKRMQVHSSMWGWSTEKDSIDFAQSLCIYHLGFTLSWYVQILNIGPLSGWRFKIFTSPLCDWLTFIPKVCFLTTESLPLSPLAAQSHPPVSLQPELAGKLREAGASLSFAACCPRPGHGHLETPFPLHHQIPLER